MNSILHQRNLTHCWLTLELRHLASFSLLLIAAQAQWRLSSLTNHGQWHRSQCVLLHIFRGAPDEGQKLACSPVLFFIRLLQSHWAQEWMSITHSFTCNIRDKSQMSVVVCQFSVQRANYFPLTIPLQVQYLLLCQSAPLFFTLFHNCSLTFHSLAPLLSSPHSLCGWSDFPLFHSSKFNYQDTPWCSEPRWMPSPPQV